MPLRASLTLLASSLFMLPATAKDFPAGYYIAQDGKTEQLTLRAEPSSNAPMAAQLPATKVLVSSGISEKADGTLWRQVSSGEMQGWLEADKLRPAEPIAFEGTELASTGICTGFEPGWAFRWTKENATFSTMEGACPEAPITSAARIRGHLGTTLHASNDTTSYSLTVLPSECPYRAVDAFVWGTAHLISHEEGKEPETFLGCCRPLDEGYR